jgi:hypothetical protein
MNGDQLIWQQAKETACFLPVTNTAPLKVHAITPFSTCATKPIQPFKTQPLLQVCAPPGVTSVNSALAHRFHLSFLMTLIVSTSTSIYILNHWLSYGNTQCSLRGSKWISLVWVSFNLQNLTRRHKVYIEIIEMFPAIEIATSQLLPQMFSSIPHSKQL